MIQLTKYGQVAEGRAIAVDIDGCLPRIMLHVGESAALLTGDMKERVQKAAEVCDP